MKTVSITSTFLSILLFAGSGFTQHCLNQSCIIADVSGSTGIAYKGQRLVSKWTTAGKACINQYHQYGSATLQKRGSGRDLSIQNQCGTNTLLFARGTNESPPLGGVIGDPLKNQLNKTAKGKWDVRGVQYTSNLFGDECLGLRGGIGILPNPPTPGCKDQLNNLADNCKNTKIFVGGFSQGAMVARICVANARDDVKKRVVGVLTFGDPFNGAPIKGYSSGKIKTYCINDDGVYNGTFDPKPSHGTYGKYASSAANWLIEHAG